MGDDREIADLGNVGHAAPLAAATNRVSTPRKARSKVIEAAASTRG
jgi:hypothetical protein